MNKPTGILLLLISCMVMFSAMPVLADPGNENGNGGSAGNSGSAPPHSTPGLDASTLTGIAAVGYIGLQYFKGCSSSAKKCDKAG
jgi:hypothetical protein